jgi:2-polyprenyl-3-methyl-5-hydroxy-6-metoxy-1,4-benzoquinol methylase
MNINKYKNFNKILNKLNKLNSTNYTKIKKFIKTQKSEYYSIAEEISKSVFYFEKKWKLKKYFALLSYDDLCKETLSEQFYLKKNDTYRAIKQEIDNKLLYSSSRKMKAYLLGLMLTQILWPSHYKILNFYRSKIKSKKKIKFLEIGSGHGLMTKYLLENSSENTGLICDISKQSLSLTKSIISKSTNQNNLQFINKDFFKLDSNYKFDLIIMGEVIEHVKNPKKFLLKAKKMLAKKGKIFLSTCANCAQIDHLYHFKCINQIQYLIKKCKLKIDSELISPSENIPKKNWKKEKIAINYCSILC